ncbi:PrpR N-terminal domain-containing protein [Megamonas hypermegale]|uniref:PrpR N-terminal domain-containing protein n=1 Tax=Megamonas hypermegale TaxID=158847 RepID=UPI0026E9D397|nr:PrpR N-terminal domain-containing protein [Megamonas hypermegale]
MNIPIIIATNKDAVQKVKQYPDISVVISRGGTARDLKKYTDKLIVDVNISFSDIFTAIETLSQQGCKRIAIISSSNLIDKMNDNININGVYLTINPYKNDDDIKLIMEKVVMNNIDGIVGDFVPISLAKNYNIKNCIYIKSDELRVLNALKEALNIVEIQQKKRLRLQTLQAIIDNINEGFIVNRPYLAGFIEV